MSTKSKKPSKSKDAIRSRKRRDAARCLKSIQDKIAANPGWGEPKADPPAAPAPFTPAQHLGKVAAEAMVQLEFSERAVAALTDAANNFAHRVRMRAAGVALDATAAADALNAAE